ANFHDNIIRWSYRTRGNEHRTHTKITHTEKVFSRVKPLPMNNNLVMNLMNIIIPYPLMKMKANKPPPYSILNPETISDSPSARSKGVRLDSAIANRSQAKNNGGENIMNHSFFCIISMVSMENELVQYTITKTNNTKQTS